MEDGQHEEQQADQVDRLDALEQKMDAQAQTMLETMQSLTKSIGAGMATLDEKVNHALELAQQPAAPAVKAAGNAGPSETPSIPVGAPLPEGTARFISPIKGLRLIVQGGGTVLAANGQPVALPFSKIEFINGVFQTDDQTLIDFMRELKDPDTKQNLLGMDYFEDPTGMAPAPYQGPTVIEGPRGTATARPEKPADLAVRAT